MNDKCYLNEKPFKQCCCNCVNLRAVYYHCTTEPKPGGFVDHGNPNFKCCCSEQKGWACVMNDDRIYDNWPQHSVGCECYTKKS